MFHIVNTCTKAAQFEGLSVQSGYRPKTVIVDIPRMSVAIKEGARDEDMSTRKGSLLVMVVEAQGETDAISLTFWPWEQRIVGRKLYCDEEYRNMGKRPLDTIKEYISSVGKEG